MRRGSSISSATATPAVTTSVFGRSATGASVRPVGADAGRSAVDLGVTLTLVATREPPTTHVARERFLTGMSAQVRGEVVGAAERPRTHQALERFLSSVNSYVSRQLVAARKPAFASLHGAHVRPLGGRTTAD